MQLPDGYRLVDIVTESRIEDYLTWSEDELSARLRETSRFGSAQEVITCGYCSAKRRCRTGKCAESDAIDWFHSHDCKSLAEASTEETIGLAPERASAPLAA